MHVQPYLFFNGRCDEAIAFYQRALGATDVVKMTYRESPEPAHVPATHLDKVMHASFRVGTTEVMCSDGEPGAKPASFQGFSLALVAEDDAKAKRLFDALGQGGQVLQPLIKTFFSSSFGMLTDRFGVGWMVVVMTA